MWWRWVEWAGIITVWLTFAYQLRSLIRLRRERKANKSLILGTLAHEEDLTELQIQSALDASAAAFYQRVEEMRRANREHDR